MLAKFIHQLRKEHGLTHAYLATELGISRPTYVQIEQDERDLTITEAKKLASIFGIPFEDFTQGRSPLRTVTLEEGKRVKLVNNNLQIRVTQKNLEKFKQVLLYVLATVGGKPNVGETVLHKLLYFIDFDYYEKFEENLMGATYIKNHHGPTSIELSAVIAQMKKIGEIEAVNSKYFKFEQKKYLPCRQADLSKFSARELEHINEVLARLSDKNAKEMENYSHGDIPWIVVKDGQPLDYESVFYRDERYSVRNYEDQL